MTTDIKHFMAIIHVFRNSVQILSTCQHMVVSCAKCGKASVLALLLDQSSILQKTGEIQNSEGIRYKKLYGSNSCIYKFSPNWFLPTRGCLILGSVWYSKCASFITWSITNAPKKLSDSKLFQYQIWNILWQ